jgi:hypothetical protein
MMFAAAAFSLAIAGGADADVNATNKRRRRPVDPNSRPGIVMRFCGPQSRCANGSREDQCRTPRFSPSCRGAGESSDGFVKQNSCRKPHEHLGEEVSAVQTAFKTARAANAGTKPAPER